MISVDHLCAFKRLAGGFGVSTKTLAQTEYRSNSPGGSEEAKHGSQLHLPSDLALYAAERYRSPGSVLRGSDENTVIPPSPFPYKQMCCLSTNRWTLGSLAAPLVAPVPALSPQWVEGRSPASTSPLWEPVQQGYRKCLLGFSPRTSRVLFGSDWCFIVLHKITVLPGIRSFMFRVLR